MQGFQLWFIALICTVFSLPARAADALAPDGNTTKPRESLRSRSQRYRADAVITLFSFPIYSRKGVGSGYAIEERWKRDDIRFQSLQFAAGSLPARAVGLNRLGFIQELTQSDPGRAPETSYFGFMTESKEESLDEARKAAKEKDSGGRYKALVGLLRPGESRSRVFNINAASAEGWADWDRLLPSVRQTVQKERQTPKTPESIQSAVPASTGSFLAAVVNEMTAKPGASDGYFVYGKGRHRLRVERTADPKMGKTLAEKSIASSADRVFRLDGTITDGGNGKKSKFRIWYEPGEESVLPLRFELQPRSFLHLVFESDPAVGSPALSFVAAGT